MAASIINAFTCDVEDYFQVSALAPHFPREQWDSVPCRVERNVDRILALLDGHGARGTFFTLGWLAERYPGLVRRIGVANFGCVEDMADLNRVVVHRDARGRGVAAQLIRAGIEWAEALGATRMLLEVRTDNDPAVGLYSRLGFDRISLRRDYYGPGVDAVVMLRPISEATGAWEQATDWALASA